MEKKTEPRQESTNKDQDNIGYENTKKRNDQDDKEADRIPTTDTDNDEGKKPDVKFSRDKK